MAQTQLAFQPENLSFNAKLGNSLRSNTYSAIARYLREDESAVNSAIPTLLPAICSFLDSNEPQSRDLGKITSLITHYRESLGNFNLNNIEPNNFATLTDIGTTDLTELFGSKLSALLDNISLVSGLIEESVFTLLALLTPYLLKQLGSHLAKGPAFTSDLMVLIDENKDRFQDLISHAKPKLAVVGKKSKESSSLFPYFIILSLAVFFIFHGLNFLSKSPNSFIDTIRGSLSSLENLEKKIRAKLNLVDTGNNTNSQYSDSEGSTSNEAMSNVESKDSKLELQFDPSTIVVDTNQARSPSKSKLFKEIGDFVNDSLGIKLRTFNLDKVKFGFGESALTPEASRELLQIVPLLKTIDSLHIEIAGHTDNSGDEDTNKRISKERADAVASLFIQNGINPANIQILGYGSSKPVASNSTLEGRYLNRRIELLLARKK